MTTTRETIAMIRMRVHSDSLLGDWLRDHHRELAAAELRAAANACPYPEAEDWLRDRASFLARATYGGTGRREQAENAAQGRFCGFGWGFYG